MIITENQDFLSKIIWFLAIIKGTVEFTCALEFKISSQYAERFGVTKAAIKYKTNRQYIYRWKRHYDGSLESLWDHSRRPHHHPNQHTPKEIKLIFDMRKRNLDAGLVVFWFKLMQRGYSRSIPGLYRFLRKQGIMAVHPPNPKYVPKPYEQMDYPGQRIQVDVKFILSVCLKNSKVIGKQFFQYTAIDEYSRWRFVEAFAEHSTYSSAMFIEHLVKAFPLPIKCIQTDNGTEFTNRFTTHRDKPTLFQKHLEQHGIRHKVIRPFTPRHAILANGVTYYPQKLLSDIHRQPQAA